MRQYSYDANGNTTKIETYGQVDPSVVECTYDVWNNMTKYAKDGAETTYTYDGTGARMSKTTGGDTRYYYWDRGYLAGEGTEDDFTMINTIGLGGVIARKHDGASDVLFKNAHGDVTATVTDGAVVHTYDYDAYGVEKNPDPADTNPFRYCGEVYDSESGNIYLRNRYYNPSIGRFTSADTHWNPGNMIYGDNPGEQPIPNLSAIMQSSNLYLYCGGNPVNRWDPSGHLEVEDETVLNRKDYVTILFLSYAFDKAQQVGNRRAMDDAACQAAAIRQKDEYRWKYASHWNDGAYKKTYEPSPNYQGGGGVIIQVVVFESDDDIYLESGEIIKDAGGGLVGAGGVLDGIGNVASIMDLFASHNNQEVKYEIGGALIRLKILSYNGSGYYLDGTYIINSRDGNEYRNEHIRYTTSGGRG